jgi:hypothetical protein
MNERFVNIKVDREERPRRRRVFMNAIQVHRAKAAAGRVGVLLARFCRHFLST